MKSVFITGAAGFIGGYVAEEFVSRGWNVTALVHRNRSLKLDRLERAGNLATVSGDAADYESLRMAFRSGLKECRAIVHCAGRASDVGRRREFRRANFDSVRNMTKLLEDEGIDRLVFISTTDVYGLRDFNGEAEDDLPLKAYPSNPYPEFKILAEHYIRNQLAPRRYSILRPAQVWGEGDTTLTRRIVDFLKWSPYIVHFGRWRGDNRWPLAHARNVATAACIAATSGEAAGKAINVLDDERTSIDEFYRILAGTYLPGKELRTVTLPFSAGYILGSCVSGISNILNLNRPFMDPSLYALYSVSRNLDFSNKRMKNLFMNAGCSLYDRASGVRELESAMEGRREQ